MVRNVILKEIKKYLESNSNFHFEDFTVTVSNNTLYIHYNWNQDYHLDIVFPETKSTIKPTSAQVQNQRIGFSALLNQNRPYDAYIIKGDYKPGKITLAESFKVENLDQVYTEIKAWLSNLWEELTAPPELRNILKINSEIEEIKTMFEDFSSEMFTKEEGNKLRDKIDDLERKLNTKIKEDKTKEGEYKKSFSELTRELEILKQLVFSVNQKNWYRNFFTRIRKWYSKEENRKMLKDGMELIRPLLPEGTDIAS